MTVNLDQGEDIFKKNRLAKFSGFQALSIVVGRSTFPQAHRDPRGKEKSPRSDIIFPFSWFVSLCSKVIERGNTIHRCLARQSELCLPLGSLPNAEIVLALSVLYLVADSGSWGRHGGLKSFSGSSPCRSDRNCYMKHKSLLHLLHVKRKILICQLQVI